MDNLIIIKQSISDQQGDADTVCIYGPFPDIVTAMEFVYGEDCWPKVPREQKWLRYTRYDGAVCEPIHTLDYENYVFSIVRPGII